MQIHTRYCVILKSRIDEYNAFANLPTYEDLNRAERIRLTRNAQYPGYEFVTVKLTYEQVTYESEQAQPTQRHAEG